MSDEVLSQAAAKAAALINESLPAASACSHAFSAKFEKKMRRIIFRMNHPNLYRTLRSVASILFVIIIGLCSILTINVEAREAVWGWIKKQHESFYEYFFVGKSDGSESSQYCPGWIPDRLHFVTVYEIEGGESYVYYDENGGITQFSYSSSPTSLKMYIQNVGYEQREVSINGLSGILYVSPNNSETNELVWSDDKKGVVFNLSAYASETELIEIAENIVIKNNLK